jgi:hypothetical protein
VSTEGAINPRRRQQLRSRIFLIGFQGNLDTEDIDDDRDDSVSRITSRSIVCGKGKTLCSMGGSEKADTLSRAGDLM